MSSKKKQGSAQEAFVLERPLQTVILALSPFVFRSVFSPETSLLDLLVNLAPSVSNTVIATSAQLADRVKRGCKVVRLPVSAVSSDAAILREIWGTGIGCPLSGDFLLLRGDALYGNFLTRFKPFPKLAERVMTRIFSSGPDWGAALLAPETGEMLEMAALSGRVASVDILSVEVLRILADQLDWEISDLPGNLWYSKHKDLISSEFASGVVLDRPLIGNFFSQSAAELVALVLSNVADFFPVLPSRRIGESGSLVAAAANVEQATLHNCTVTGEARLSGRFTNCVISGSVELIGNFSDCLISGSQISLEGDFVNCLLVDDSFVLKDQSGPVSGLRRILGERLDGDLPAASAAVAAAAPMVGCGAMGVNFAEEVNEYIFEAREEDADSLESAAKQLRIFRTTQTQSMDAMVEAVAMAVAKKSLAETASRQISKTSEKQQSMLATFETWSEILSLMYMEHEYLENSGLDLLATEFQDDFWMVLWAMYQTEFFVDRKLILDWPVHPAVTTSAGLAKFLAFLRTQDEEDDQDSSSGDDASN